MVVKKNSFCVLELFFNSEKKITLTVKIVKSAIRHSAQWVSWLSIVSSGSMKRFFDIGVKNFVKNDNRFF